VSAAGVRFRPWQPSAIALAVAVIVFGFAPRLILDRACDVRSSLLIGYTDITCGPVAAAG